MYGCLQNSPSSVFNAQSRACSSSSLFRNNSPERALPGLSRRFWALIKSSRLTRCSRSREINDDPHEPWLPAEDIRLGNPKWACNPQLARGAGESILLHPSIAIGTPCYEAASQPAPWARTFWAPKLFEWKWNGAQKNHKLHSFQCGFARQSLP